ncbi:hypothetical protein [Halobacteriovorax sp. ZH2_bin.1]|uniref:hypothetical protein n=1 Tax=Halobacteriovorax sp. ZH2_bin.1 TaxID=3157724 RepID=UPI00371920B2
MNSLFIYLELREQVTIYNFLKRDFNGVTKGETFNKVRINLGKGHQTLKSGHYVFKLSNYTIANKTLAGDVVNYKSFKEE